MPNTLPQPGPVSPSLGTDISRVGQGELIPRIARRPARKEHARESAKFPHQLFHILFVPIKKGLTRVGGKANPNRLLEGRDP